MKAVPDLGTLRRIPWLEKTALVFCDLYTEEGEPIEVSPRRILQRQVDRAAKLGYRVMVASELELYLFKESFAEARAKRYHGLTPVSQYIEDYHILQTTKEEGLVRAIRNGMEAARGAGRVLEGRVGLRAGGDQPPLRRAGRDGRPPHALQARGEGDRPRPGQLDHVHGEVRHGLGGLVVPPPLEPVGPDGQEEPLPREGPALRLGPLRALAGRPDGDGARALVLLRALRQLVQALPGGVVRARRGSWPAGTTAPAASGSAARARRFRVENRIPGADANPYLAFAATIAAGLHGIQKKLPAPRVYEGNAYEDPKLPQVPKTLREAIAELEGSRVAREALGDEVRRALPPHRAARAAGVRPGRDRLGADAGLRAHLTAPVAVIVNPAAGPAGPPDRASVGQALAERALAARGAEGDGAAHRGAGPRARARPAAVAARAAVVCAWGGDGTVNEVARAVAGTRRGPRRRAGRLRERSRPRARRPVGPGRGARASRSAGGSA